MANQETQILDDVIVASRRKMITMGATSLAGLALGAIATSKAEAQAASYTDADILNFALNLEYLEANFYYLAAFGTTIDKATAASTAAGAPLITLSGTVGTAGTVSGGSQVPFSTITVASYAIETAVEEGKHVQLLLSALGSSAAAQPAINLGTSFQVLGGAAKTSSGANFHPYQNDANFLMGAYVFEDVGVTAYHGAASLLTSASNLTVAAGILAVEAYHAGLVRTSLLALYPYLLPDTVKISALRATLSQAGLLGATPSAFDGNPDDVGVGASVSVSLAGTTATASSITNADPTNAIAFARNTTQVLNIVTAGGAASGSTAVSPAKGLFFPNGMNAGPNGFK